LGDVHAQLNEEGFELRIPEEAALLDHWLQRSHERKRLYLVLHEEKLPDSRTLTLGIFAVSDPSLYALDCDEFPVERHLPLSEDK
jgi:hypothetical protein